MQQKVESFRKCLLEALNHTLPGSSDFDLNDNLPSLVSTDLCDAAVLIAIHDINNNPNIILTKRSSALENHPGQIALPGGKIDAEDKTAINAALREAEEEISLMRGQVEVLGCMPKHITITRFRVTPVVAIVKGPFIPNAEENEVEEVFSVPFSFLMALESYTICARKYLGSERYYYTVPYGPYYIWGATARILRAFAERLRI